MEFEFSSKIKGPLDITMPSEHIYEQFEGVFNRRLYAF
jgi:hypothetical protein